MFILVMHRVAPDDLAGTLQKQGGYFTVVTAARGGEEEGCSSRRRGDVIMTRQPGELLHPGRMTPEQLERLKREISPHAFASQYQQRPVAGGSGMCLASTALHDTTNLRNSEAHLCIAGYRRP